MNQFAAEWARWTVRTLLQPNQHTQFLATGKLTLELQLNDARELAMDLLQHGKHVRVPEPADRKHAATNESTH